MATSCCIAENTIVSIFLEFPNDLGQSYALDTFHERSLVFCPEYLTSNLSHGWILIILKPYQSVPCLSSFFNLLMKSLHFREQNCQRLIYVACHCYRTETERTQADGDIPLYRGFINHWDSSLYHCALTCFRAVAHKPVTQYLYAPDYSLSKFFSVMLVIEIVSHFKCVQLYQNILAQFFFLQSLGWNEQGELLP